MRKNHCSIRKNTIRYNHFIQERTPQISLEMTNLSKNLPLGLEIITWSRVLFPSDKLLTSNNCCKTLYQPNSFAHSLTNLLYWAYWAHPLLYLGLGYDLWLYRLYFWLTVYLFLITWHLYSNLSLPEFSLLLNYVLEIFISFFSNRLCSTGAFLNLDVDVKLENL